MIKLKTVRQKGFTLLEFLISMSILLAVMGLVTNFLYQNWETSSYLKTQAVMKDATQTSLYSIARRLAQSKRLYGNGTMGLAHLNKLEFAEENKNRVVLPTIRTNGSLVSTKSCNDYPDNYFWPLSFGNSIFFVELKDTLDSYGFDPSLDIISRKINVYQFVLYYVESNDSYPLLDSWNSPASMRTQRLMRWESALYADYDEYRSFLTYLNGVDSALRADVLTVLENRNIVGLWNSKETNPNLAFYNLVNNLNPGVKNNAYRIEQLFVRPAVLLPELDNTLYSLAYNRNMDKASSEYFPIRTTVPAFYDDSPTPNASDCGENALPATAAANAGPLGNAFPGGFEVGIVGPNSGRSVFINMTVIGRFKGNRIVEQNHSISAFSRDY